MGGKTGTWGAWGALLLALFGLGSIGAGVFVADPMSGFPLGTPAGRPQSVSLQAPSTSSRPESASSASAARFVIGQRFAGEPSLTGLLFLVGFAGLASGSSSAVAVLGFWAVLLLAWAWPAALAISLYRRVGEAA